MVNLYLATMNVNKRKKDFNEKSDELQEITSEQNIMQSNLSFIVNGIPNPTKMDQLKRDILKDEITFGMYDTCVDKVFPITQQDVVDIFYENVLSKKG